MQPKRVKAIRTPESLWHVFGDTYQHKQELKQVGGHFFYQTYHHWVLTDEQLLKLSFPLTICILCRVAAHCHEPEQSIRVDLVDILKGTVRLGCGMCDTPASCGTEVSIIEVEDKVALEIGKKVLEHGTVHQV